MFRKPKRKATTRTREHEDEKPQIDNPLHLGDDDQHDRGRHDGGGESRIVESADRLREDSESDDDGNTSELFRRGNKKRIIGQVDRGEGRGNVMHSYASGPQRPSHADLATRAAEHHAAATAAPGAATTAGTDALPTSSDTVEESVGKGPDGIFRNKARNKFAAGPIRAQTNVRVTARFDYQPDICKDYKDTGFCGFGDTCIYLHDRGDTMSGWQLEQAWEQQQEAERKRRAQEEQMQAFVDSHGTNLGADSSATGLLTDDGLPFACYLCRKAFVDPVVTSCGHYFCESCILNHVRTESEMCPVCQQETNGVFNHPTKLIAKMKRVLRSTSGDGGRSRGSQDAQSSWQTYYDALANPSSVATK